MRWIPIVVVLLATTEAYADNHFLLELEGGVALPAGVDAEPEMGGAYGGSFGIGGRFRGHAPAYYLVARLGRSGFGFVGPPRSGRAVVERRQTEAALGPRVYVPLTRRLRLLLQVGFGQTYDTAAVTREGHRAFEYETAAFTIFGDAGLQYRFTEHFSLGVGGGLSILTERSASELAALSAGVDDGGPLGRGRVGLTTTIHF